MYSSASGRACSWRRPMVCPSSCRATPTVAQPGGWRLRWCSQCELQPTCALHPERLDMNFTRPLPGLLSWNLMHVLASHSVMAPRIASLERWSICESQKYSTTPFGQSLMAPAWGWYILRVFPPLTIAFWSGLRSSSPSTQSLSSSLPSSPRFIMSLDSGTPVMFTWAALFGTLNFACRASAVPVFTGTAAHNVVLTASVSARASASARARGRLVVPTQGCAASSLSGSSSSTSHERGSAWPLASEAHAMRSSNGA
mmetsp:Transcript_9333/g.21965  ORF Transcript_9333/g.21965 Transcript_9333/m.21965 type:complete len:256 (+) Transcript_9333:780-1547(+)